MIKYLWFEQILNENDERFSRFAFKWGVLLLADVF